MPPQLPKSPKDYVVTKLFMNKTGQGFPGYANFDTIQGEFRKEFLLKDKIRLRKRCKESYA